MEKTHNRQHLIETLNYQLGLNKREAKEIIEVFWNVIKQELIQGKNVKLPGFGSFHLLDKKSRIGRNPKTLETHPIPARRVVRFHQSNKLKEKIRVYSESESKHFSK